MAKLAYQTIINALIEHEEVECYICAFELGTDFKPIRNIHPIKGVFKKGGIIINLRYSSQKVLFHPYGKNNAPKKVGISMFSQKNTFLKCFDYEEEAFAEYFSLQKDAVKTLNSIKSRIDESIEEISKM